MDKTELIRNLVRDSIRRAVQESIAAVIVIIAFGFYLTKAEIGSPMYYGCLMLLIASGFISGVVWSFALSYRLLRMHPVSDSTFWQEAFAAQSRLLRLVPLWYCAPACLGILLCAAPSQQGEFAHFLLMVVIVAVLFACITWLNRRAAAKLDEFAQAFAT